MVLRTSRRYNPGLDQVIFGDGTPVTRESLCLGGLLQDYVNDMFEFARRMSVMGVDNAEYALLTAICIFSGMYFMLHRIIQVFYRILKHSCWLTVTIITKFLNLNYHLLTHKLLVRDFKRVKKV